MGKDIRSHELYQAWILKQMPNIKLLLTPMMFLLYFRKNCTSHYKIYRKVYQFPVTDNYLSFGEKRRLNMSPNPFSYVLFKRYGDEIMTTSINMPSYLIKNLRNTSTFLSLQC